MASAAPMLLVSGVQDAIKGRFRCQLTALIGQPRDDLARRQIGMLRAVAQVQDGHAFTAAKGVGRHGAKVGGVGIGIHDGLPGPALQGAQRQPQLVAGDGLAGPVGEGLGQVLNEFMPYWQQGQLSSLSSPQ